MVASAAAALKTTAAAVLSDATGPEGQPDGARLPWLAAAAKARRKPRSSSCRAQATGLRSARMPVASERR